MARELQVLTWCDPCLADGVRLEGVEHVAALDGKPRMLALCDAHRTALWAPLAGVLAAHGQPVEQVAAKPTAGSTGSAAAQPGDRPCPLPDCDEHTSAKRLSDHVRRQHGMGLKEARALYGLPLGPGRVTPTPPRDCPECGQTCASGTGLASHLRLSHSDLDPTQRAAVFARAS